MTVNLRVAVVFALIHVLANHAHEPQDAREVVDVFVRQKNFAHVLPVEARVFELSQNCAAAAVNQKIFVAAALLKSAQTIVATCRHQRSKVDAAPKLYSPKRLKIMSTCRRNHL